MKALNSPLEVAKSRPDGGGESDSSNKLVRTRTERLLQLASSMGMVPVRLFLEMSRTCSRERRPSVEGILPSKRFPLSKRVVRFEHVPMLAGMLPTKKLLERLK